MSSTTSLTNADPTFFSVGTTDPDTTNDEWFTTTTGDTGTWNINPPPNPNPYVFNVPSPDEMISLILQGEDLEGAKKLAEMLGVDFNTLAKIGLKLLMHKMKEEIKGELECGS